MREEKATYKCENCGGEVRYDGGEQKFLCMACHTEYHAQPDNATVTEKDFDIQKLLVSSAELSGVKTAVCQNCGGEVFFDDKESAARCPMCGSAQIRESAGKALIKPDGIVPFKVEPEDAQESFRRFVSKRFFAPSALKNAFEEGKLEGWYIPFWTFDAHAEASYTAEGGKSVKVIKDGKETAETRWSPVSGALSADYDDVLTCAAKSDSAKMTELLGDYDTSAVLPYSAQYLQGYLAEYRSIEAKEAFEAAKDKMIYRLERDARNEIRQKGFSQDRRVQVKAQFKEVTCKSILLPLYRAGYSFGGKLYEYIINGQTGKVSAKYPKSALKIILVILAVAAVIAGLVLLSKLR